jgi:hypothetical protein
MHKIVIALAFVVIGLAITLSSAKASPATDALGACLSDSTTGKDRKDMAKWMFMAISVHPEIHSFSNIPEKKRDEINMAMGALITKLLTESCPAQAKEAVEKGGSDALKTAFGVVGQLAMQELMSNPEVNSSISGFVKYVDKNKMDSAFTKK